MGNKLLLPEVRQLPISMGRSHPLRPDQQGGGLQLVPEQLLCQVRGRPLQGTVDKAAERQDK